ncbi:MAG: PAS domain S-box protein [Nostocaceae cyanobacterium]|nr:PAS domain S-box protein [Nostocaceae cyanobacterium]
MADMSFMPHGMCYLWRPGLVGIHLVSNAIIATSYFSIPLTLVHIVRKRQDVPYNWIFFLFAAFIVCCGIGHGFDIWTLWHPNYWLSGYIRAITALVSATTAIALVYLIPKILALPSKAAMEAINQQLAEESMEKEEAEAAKRRNEKLYQLLADNSTDIVAIHTPERIYKYVSPACHSLLGYQPEELVGKSIYDIFHPEDAKALQKTKAAIGKLPDSYTHSYRARCQDGNYIWLETKYLTIRAEEQETAQEILSLSRDITARKQIELEISQLNEELEKRVERRTTQLELANRQKDELIVSERQARQQNEIYQDIVENIPLGFCIWHLENPDDVTSLRLVNINPAAIKILEIPLQEELGKPIGECFPNMLSEEYRWLLEAYGEVAKSGQVKFLETINYGDDRICKKIFSLKAFPLPNNCIGVAFEDITESKRIQTALAESENLYRSVVNSVQEVIFQIDKSGCWNFISAAWTEITGFTIAESLHQPFTNLMYAQEDQQRSSKLFQSLITGKEESYQLEFRILRKDGDFRWLEMCAQLQHNTSGELMGCWGTLNDVTERKQTEAVLEARAKELTNLNAILLNTTQQLEKRNAELDQFAYVTSHDLKAPLRAIANLSEWIEEDIADVLTEDTKRQMDLLRGRVHRMEGLINGLLQYSRAGRIQGKLETIAVSELLTEIIDSVAPPAEFKVEIEGEMPTFATEYLPLQQVFSNLITNAIKHHHRSDGKVNISVQDQGNYYEFIVADDGPGIEPQYHDKVFEIFQTLQARDKNENTGIGLAIVKKIIENQGGTIKLESQIGEGTTFRFTWMKQTS